jgi:hypothetical protein
VKTSAPVVPILALVLLLPACGTPCNRTADLHNCIATWVCGTDTFVAQCPRASGPTDTTVNPACVCTKNGVLVSQLGDSAYDWCDLADAAEKTSWANGHCGWSFPVTY